MYTGFFFIHFRSLKINLLENSFQGEDIQNCLRQDRQKQISGSDDADIHVHFLI